MKTQKLSRNHEHISVVDELRQSTRYLQEPQTEYAVIWRTAGAEILAEVHDESLGGLGLIIPQSVEMQVGDEWEIVYLSRVYRGVVKHVQPPSDGSRIVGFQCELACEG